MVRRQTLDGILLAVYGWSMVDGRRSRYLDDHDSDDSSALMIECPTLECSDATLVPDVCYLHDGNPQAIVLQGKSCNNEAMNQRIVMEPSYCPFNLEKYMWVDETYQG